MTLLVGISGVRGLVGESLTPQVVLEFAQAYGTLLGGGRVVLARDSRPSGPMYGLAAAAGLVAAGCEVTELGVAMTPTVAHAIRNGGYNGGISITASHNPGPWNGLKFFDHEGIGPTREQADTLATLQQSRAFRQLRENFAPLHTDPEAGRRHVQAVLAAVEVDLTPLRGMPVVLDSVNGAGGIHTPILLEELGLRVTHMNREPTGIFAHPPEPLAENLAELCQTVKKQRAAIGLAQDPDGDRLALVDENGVYIGEEYTLALSAWSVLSRRQGPVAANLSTSRLVDDVAARFGAKVYRTPVGESHVARQMLASGCVVGGEGNGGVIDPRISLVRDSLSGISLVLQLIAQTGRTVSGLVGELPRYFWHKQKITCPRQRVAEAVERVVRRFAEREPNTADGVRVDFPDGWVHLRASNTEPVVRVIAEAASEEEARRLSGLVLSAAGL
jgi:phosphomannomutase